MPLHTAMGPPEHLQIEYSI